VVSQIHASKNVESHQAFSFLQHHLNQISYEVSFQTVQAGEQPPSVLFPILVCYHQQQFFKHTLQ
jgi:hypothetical protein